MTDNNFIYYPIVKLMDGSEREIEVPHTWLENCKIPIVGAYYYCNRYKCGCQVITKGDV